MFVPKDLSFNPRQAICMVCSSDMPFALMVGNTHLLVCAHCGFEHVGRPDNGRCHRCQCIDLVDKGVPPPEMKFPFTRPCSQACADKMARANAMVALGGIFVRCQKCSYLIKSCMPDDERTVEFRKEHPSRVTQEVSEDLCPKCNNESKTEPGHGQ